jgi:hypothetical protein
MNAGPISLGRADHVSRWQANERELNQIRAMPPALMKSADMAAIGLIPGTIYGFVRLRRRIRARIPNADD